MFFWHFFGYHPLIIFSSIYFVRYLGTFVLSRRSRNYQQVGSGEVFSIAEEEPGGGKGGGKGKGGRGDLGGRDLGQDLGGGGKPHKEETEVLLSPR